MIRQAWEALLSGFNSEARRAKRARGEFNKLVQAYDDAIARATAKHLPTASLRQAKQAFVHRCLGGAAQ